MTTDGQRADRAADRYKWVALTNATLGVLVVTINSSIVIISLPAIFRGIRLNPLQPANVSYLLWILLGFLVVTSVLVVSFGRLGDSFGRVRLYNLGFAIFTACSIGLSLIFAPAVPRPAPGGRMDWWGSVLFAVGLVAVLVGLTSGIQPYGRPPAGGADPARPCPAMR